LSDLGRSRNLTLTILSRRTPLPQTGRSRRALTMSGWFTLFTNCRYILDGELVEDHLVISDETGLILKRDGYIGGEAVDLEDSIIAPGFLELHTNGANGFHFTHFEEEESYAAKIDDIGRYYATQGVTGFYATLPTVKSEEFQKVRTPLGNTHIPSALLCSGFAVAVTG
jgi:N-acetylglucosamine-6-phosphate deacetylase